MQVNFVHAAITLASFTGLAIAASCSSDFTNLRDTTCAQQLGNATCASLNCGGSADLEANNAHVEATLSDGACPDNCYSAVSDILEQCIANGWSDGTWSEGGEWYWVWSENSNDDACS
ncbi:hypothetical protein C8R45DRAFT_921953 [Mycena sanguinolenta]|nr:hypothetical protein C8R45DRAFT_921953 [Mycena sanguinolenta]